MRVYDIIRNYATLI